MNVPYEIIKQRLIQECIEAGKFYLDCSYLVIGEKWCVDLYYHSNYAMPFKFDSELAYEMFITKLSNGYKDYELFRKECDYNMEERLESLCAAALK